MVVEVVEQDADQGYYRRVVNRLIVVVAVLTVGMIVLWLMRRPTDRCSALQ